MDEDSDEFPLWVVIVIVGIVIVFSAVTLFICCLMRRNRDSQRLTESAIAHELALAKQEGVEIPDDLEKSLSRF